MKTNTAFPLSFLRRASLFTWLWLVCLLIGSGLTSAYAANTFSNAGPLADGRYNHTATLLPNGRVLVAGGAMNNSNTLTSAELFDPATGGWAATAGSLATPRHSHTATLLENGKVLVAGGSNSGVRLSSAEFYDPATDMWVPIAGSLVTARSGHSATLLPGGKVLIAGGFNGATLANAELFDPATGLWTATGSLATAREVHTATLLPNGKVLVAAGFNGGALASTELYDPASGAWTPATSPLARYGHTATLLPAGKLLVAGGISAGNRLTSSELYDPATDQWSGTGVLTTKRNLHTATLLPNGKVLATGGQTNSTVFLTSAEIYDPASGIWSTATGSLANARYLHTTTLLPGGTVLVVAGVTTGGGRLASTEVFDPAMGGWSVTGALATARSDFTATLLPNGKVLVAGANAGGPLLATAELYDPASGAWNATGAPSVWRRGQAAALLPNGKVLIIGGEDSPALASAESFDSVAGTWSAAGNVSYERSYPTATLLPNGKLLVVGGAYYNIDGYDYLAGAELHDPATGRWSGTDALGIGRITHSAILLPNGKVLVAGGLTNSGPTFWTSSVELYDPATGTWDPAVSMPGPIRDYHTATLLHTGKLLVAGGRTNSAGGLILARAQIYDPATGTWSDTGSLAAARFHHTATLLPNGKVLVAGGFVSYDSPQSGTATTELYDPATGAWSAAGPLVTGRFAHTATLLPNGKVLVAGGETAPGLSTTSAELYDVGLGYSPAWQPQISSASFDATGRLVLTGTGFRGVSSASGGNGSQDSPTNHPVVELRRLGNEQSAFLSPDAGSTLSATVFISAPVAPFSGHALVTVFANGIPSPAVFPTGSTLTFTRDTDGDGMSDAAEFQLASLGFDWSVSQPELVNVMLSNLNGALPNLNAAGFYTAAQVQALNVGVPLIQKNATTGDFKLTIGIGKSTNLMNFVPFPFLAPQTTINGQGKIEFLFSVPDNAAFFRLEAP